MNLIPFALLLAASLAVAGCSSESGEPVAVVGDVRIATPVPDGHGIGRARVHWTDASRSDAGTASGMREVHGWLYYPAEGAPVDGGVALDGAWAEAYRPTLERRIGAAASDAMLRARWHATTAPAAAGRFPVLVFAPGYRQLPTNYNVVLEALVARGYVVLALASPGLADVVPLADGRVAPKVPLDDAGYDTLARDIASAIAELPAFDAAQGQAFAAHLDLSRIGVFGHSLGGAAAVLASARVPGIRAAANLDGDYAGDSAVEQPRVPLLYITSQPPNRAAAPKSEWEDESNEVRRDRIWRNLASLSPRAQRVRVGGMFHSNFQDEALLPPAAIPRKLRGNRFGSIDGARGLELASRLLAGFFAEHLGGPAADDVSAVVAQFPESDVQVLREGGQGESR